MGDALSSISGRSAGGMSRMDAGGSTAISWWKGRNGFPYWNLRDRMVRGEN